MAAKNVTIEKLCEAIQEDWPSPPSAKAKNYIGKFFQHQRMGQKIEAQVDGNYGIYTVSIQLKGTDLSSACSCYIGSGGGCHHSEALAFTFLQESKSFKVIKTKKISQVRDIGDLRKYLKSVTLETLIQDLKSHGITQKAFAEGIGMNPRHLSSIKSSELRNRYYNELGATKLACLWVLEHCKSTSSK